MMAPLSQAFEFLPKTGRPASFGQTEGAFPFFTSSPIVSKWTDRADCEGPALVFGTGGSASVHYAEGRFSATNDCYVAVPKSGKAEDAKFFYRFLQSNMHLIESGFRGAGLQHVSKKHLEHLELPIGSEVDRARINAILDKADGLRRKRRRASELAADFLRSAFLHLFGDPANNPHRFDIEVIAKHLSKERAGTQSGPFGSALKKHEYVESGVPVWGVDNVQHNEFVAKAKLFITEKKFEQLERYRVLPGDVLISRAGTVGRMCIAKPTTSRSIISTNLVRVVLETGTLLPEYFVALFTYLPHRLGALKANNKDNAFTFLNPKTLKALEIPIPPMEQQIKFKRLSEKTDGHLLKMNEQLCGLEDLFQSLSQRAFRGEL